MSDTPTGYLAAVRYRQQSEQPFASRLFRTREAAANFAALWTLEAESLGYTAVASITTAPLPVREDTDERESHGLPWGSGGGAKAAVAARRMAVMAELSRRGLTLWDTPLPVREMAEVLSMSRSGLGDTLGALRELAKREAEESVLEGLRK